MSVLDLRLRFGWSRRAVARPDEDGALLCAAAADQPVSHPDERFALDYLAGHGQVTRAALVRALEGRIAQRERSIGGGALDLGLWGDALWRDEARRVVARLEQHQLITAAAAGQGSTLDEVCQAGAAAGLVAAGCGLR